MWAPVAACAAWAAVRGLGLDSGYPLVPLMAFTPIAAGAAVLAVLLAAALRRWRAAAVAAVAAAVLVGLVAPRAVGGPTERRGPELRVVTSNLKLGKASPEALLAVVRRRRADVLSLQEIDARSIGALRAAGLDELMPHRVVRLGRDYAGTALFSRFALEPLPVLRGSSYPVAGARVALPGAPPVELRAVHPPPPISAARVAVWEREHELLPAATAAGPVRILAGDFNATLDHDALRDLIGTGYADAAERIGTGLRATWPVGRRIPPAVTIDHVLADRRAGVRDYGVHEIAGSDHKAVFAALILPRTPPP